MALVPRWYQAEAIDAGLTFLHEKRKGNGLAICPTASGKSVIISGILAALDGMTVVLQPSKEILQQNFEKHIANGGRGGIYSASAGVKHVDTITFCTIGSIDRKHHLFSKVKYILIDECHLVDPDDGMYYKFIKAHPHAKVLGFTATPYRLTTGFDGAMLKFLNRTSPRIFNRVVYCIQNDVLFNAGYLAKLEYFDFKLIDGGQLKLNSKGTDFTEASLKEYYRTLKLPQRTIEYGNRLLLKRKNLLIFCSLVSEAMVVSKGIPGSVVLTGETETGTRSKILTQFKAGIIRCVINVGVLTTGFDMPTLEAVLIARKMMSLALYYQIVGRVMRIHPKKESSWVVDLGGNVSFFGKIETMRVVVDDRGLYSVWNNGRQLTNVTFSKN
jgi:DNA repair protein RadD